MHPEAPTPFDATEAPTQNALGLRQGFGRRIAAAATALSSSEHPQALELWRLWVTLSAEQRAALLHVARVMR
jgi:hypothetical protein